MMDNLSPAAQSVLDAFLNGYICSPECNVAFESDRNAVAAALVAAADQVVPVSDRPDPSNEFEYGQWLAKHTTRSYLLAIAAELEGTNG